MLLQHPGSAGVVCAALADLWKEERPDVIVGPALGGILVAYETARALGAKALFTERKEGEMKLRRGFTISPSDRIVVSEDIVTSGKSAKETIKVLQEAGGNVIGVTSIGNRNPDNPFDLPFRSLVHFDFPVYQPDDCPLCREGAPLVKPGSRQKV
jgi:orotate phosphoribosyltransferase